MNMTPKQGAILPLMARLMVPFRRSLGYSFDTDSFLNDETYAQIIIQQAIESADINLQTMGRQLAVLLSQRGDADAPAVAAPSFAQTTTPQVPPVPASAAVAKPSQADLLRAELLRKYQGGIR